MVCGLRKRVYGHLLGVKFGLRCEKHILENQRVQWFTDNKKKKKKKKKKFVRLSKKGSMKRDLQKLSLDIFQICSKHSISIEIEWICRESNTKADMISNS